MELYYNNKTYELQNNTLYESLLNEDDSNAGSQQIDDKLDNAVDDPETRKKLEEFIKKYSPENSKKDNTNLNDINNLDNISNLISNFKIDL